MTPKTTSNSFAAPIVDSAIAKQFASFSIEIFIFNDKEYAFVIFSDDINWCKEYFGESERIYYIDKNIDFVDMCMMSLCDHNIIANSTFSWWGAWLSNSEDVIAPTNWFGSEAGLDDKDLVPERWERIDA